MKSLIFLVCFGITYQKSVADSISAFPDVNNHNEVTREDTAHNGFPSEIVGSPRLFQLHALAARAKARAFVNRAKVHARLRHPLLLQPTPAEFLQDDEQTTQLQNRPTLSTDYIPLSKIIKHSKIRTSDETTHLPSSARYEVYENAHDYNDEYSHNRPCFSIIPINWKPPLESNLYGHNEYLENNNREPFLTVLPGKWKTNDDKYDTYYSENYDIIPISFNILDNYRRRSAKSDNAFTHTFSDHLFINKKPLQEWSANQDSSDFESKEEIRNDKFREQRHFHGHDHTHSHAFIHHYIHGKPHYHHQNLQDKKFESSYQHFSSSHFPVQHNANFGFDQQHSLSSHSSSLPFRHQLTINKQQTTVIVPPNNHQDVQISQISGSNNAISQSQANGASSHNIQSSQINGNHNSVSQTQASAAPFLSHQPNSLVRTPMIVNFSKFNRRFSGEPLGFFKKRSILPFSKKSNIELDRDASSAIKRQKHILNLVQYEKNGLLKGTELAKLQHLIYKRSVPLLRLIVDPNAKVDVPKTLENMGTVVKSSFEDKRAPMYHIKNSIGSTKDLFLSILRIPPQNLFVPSRYEIVDREYVPNDNTKKIKPENERVGAINPALLPSSQKDLYKVKQKTNKNSFERSEPILESPNEPFSETYKQIGAMLRDSIRSGQDALNHVGEIYHSTRKALATSRHVAPRIILSSMRIPAVEKSAYADNNNLLVITPKILQLKQEAVGVPHFVENQNKFVGIGHVMNSLGISNPNANKVDTRRIVLHAINPDQSKLLRKTSLKNIKSHFAMSDTLKQDDLDEDINDTLLALENAKGAVGANNLKEFISKVKNRFTDLFKNSLNRETESNKLKNITNKYLENSQFKTASFFPKHLNHQKFSPEAHSTPKKKKPEKLFYNKEGYIQKQESNRDANGKFQSGDYIDLNKGRINVADNEEIISAINPNSDSAFKYLSRFHQNYQHNESSTETIIQPDLFITNNTIRATTDGGSSRKYVSDKSIRNNDFKSTRENTNIKSNNNNRKNLTSLLNNNTEDVGISMIMGKALLTPFMDKLEKEEYTVLNSGEYNSNIGRSDTKENDKRNQ